MMDFSLEDGVDSSRYTVDSFASMFKEYYDNQIAVGNISPDASYSDFVKLMLPQSYTIEKDLRWWEKFGKEVLYGLGVGQLISLIIGVDLITGAQLSSAQVEKYGKDVAGRVASLLLTYGMSTALEGTAVAGRRLVQVLASSLTYYSVQGVGSAAEWPQWVTTSLALTASLLVAFGMEGWVQNGFKPKLDTDNLDEIISTPERRTWEQSEHEIGNDYSDYEKQKSFLDGKEVDYGTPGSSRPDGYKPGSSLEIKNYNIETAQGRSNLVNNVSKQINERIKNLPEGTKQIIVIDVRGQNYTQDILDSIVSRIMSKTKVKVEIRFYR